MLTYISNGAARTPEQTAVELAEALTAHGPGVEPLNPSLANASPGEYRCSPSTGPLGDRHRPAAPCAGCLNHQRSVAGLCGRLGYGVAQAQGLIKE
jgi:hypothetical protein